MTFFGIVPTFFGTTRTPVVHAPLQPQGDFGHQPTIADLAVNLRHRAAQAHRLDDVPVSPRELTIILDALEATP